MTVTVEMQKLRKGLDDRKIAWKDVSNDSDSCWICRTHFEINNNFWSVVHGFNTYGGISIWQDVDYGLLELMTSELNGGEPVGFLTAEDVLKEIDRIKKGGAENGEH